jgi:hypothetical protein
MLVTLLPYDALLVKMCFPDFDYRDYSWSHNYEGGNWCVDINRSEKDKYDRESPPWESFRISKDISRSGKHQRSSYLKKNSGIRGLLAGAQEIFFKGGEVIGLEFESLDSSRVTLLLKPGVEFPDHRKLFRIARELGIYAKIEHVEHFYIKSRISGSEDKMVWSAESAPFIDRFGQEVQIGSWKSPLEWNKIGLPDAPALPMLKYSDVLKFHGAVGLNLGLTVIGQGGYYDYHPSGLFLSLNLRWLKKQSYTIEQLDRLVNGLFDIGIPSEMKETLLENYDALASEAK